ncbi:MBL fold metallo-hydrolase [Amycolatopsis sp. cg5]|uniref:MBL fold metallo-hydrolase n=1 Tax=Amycolatopsis sp. cg5 TaxID=3238802 RepID=UPI003525F7A5
MRVHHLDCGTMRPLGGKLVDGRSSLFGRAEMVCHCLLVETGAGLTLVETGMGSPIASRGEEWLGRRFIRTSGPVLDQDAAVTQIKKLGYDPRDVADIVLTHLDLDHAGGLVDFPEANVHVYAEELRAFERPREDEVGRYRAVQFTHRPKWTSHAALGEPWFGFDAVREIAPDILLIPLAGHTRGHAGVAVDTGDGWLLHAGDSYFHPGEIDPVSPHCPPLLALFEGLVQTEKRARLDNQQRLRDLVRDHSGEVTVFSAHNAAEFHRLRERSTV